mgnify:CR=1 FL=1
MRFSFLLAQGLLGLGLLGLSCSSPPKPAATDDTVVRFAERANLAFGRGRMDDAVRAFEQGLQRARETDDPQAIGDAAYNLGVCRFQLGEVVEATELFREALYELDRAGDALADVFVMLAKASARLGDPVGAEALAAAVEADPRSRPTYQHRAEIEAVVQGADRDTAFDTLTASIGAARRGAARCERLGGGSGSPEERKGAGRTRQRPVGRSQCVGPQRSSASEEQRLGRSRR